MKGDKTMSRSLLNRSEVIRYIKDINPNVRPGWIFSRVSNFALDKIEAHLKNYIKELLHNHPSVGKTFNP